MAIGNIGVLRCPGTTIAAFNYSAVLAGEQPLSAIVYQITGSTITLSGSDFDQPTTPFTINWADGVTTDGFFPLVHTYASTNQNYDITVTSHENDGSSFSAETAAVFVAPVVSHNLNVAFTPVSFPQSVGNIQGGFGLTPTTSSWQPFTDFGIDGQSSIEYVLSVAASVAFRMDNSTTNLDPPKMSRAPLPRLHANRVDRGLPPMCSIAQRNARPNGSARNVSNRPAYIMLSRSIEHRSDTCPHRVRVSP